MKNLLFAGALALAVCIGVSGCTVHPVSPSVTVTPADAATQAMLAAETAFNVAATAELDAKALGVLVGDKAAEADGVRHQAYAALQAMRIVYRQGQSPDPTQLLALTNALLAAAGKTPVEVAAPNLSTIPSVK